MKLVDVAFELLICLVNALYAGIFNFIYRCTVYSVLDLVLVMTVTSSDSVAVGVDCSLRNK